MTCVPTFVFLLTEVVVNDRAVFSSRVASMLACRENNVRLLSSNLLWAYAEFNKLPSPNTSFKIGILRRLNGG